MNKKRWLAIGAAFTLLTALLMSCTANNASEETGIETAVAPRLQPGQHLQPHPLPLHMIK